MKISELQLRNCLILQLDRCLSWQEAVGRRQEQLAGAVCSWQEAGSRKQETRSKKQEAPPAEGFTTLDHIELGTSPPTGDFVGRVRLWRKTSNQEPFYRSRGFARTQRYALPIAIGRSQKEWI